MYPTCSISVWWCHKVKGKLFCYYLAFKSGHHKYVKISYLSFILWCIFSEHEQLAPLAGNFSSPLGSGGMENGFGCCWMCQWFSGWYLISVMQLSPCITIHCQLFKSQRNKYCLQPDRVHVARLLQVHGWKCFASILSKLACQERPTRAYFLCL